MIPSNAVLCADTSVPVFSSSPGSVMTNRRLILKQLPSGQFALTVQSLEPDDLGGSSFVISNSQSVDTSTCSVTVESSCESDVPNSHVCYTCFYVTLLSCQLLALSSECVFVSSINCKLTTYLARKYSDSSNTVQTSYKDFHVLFLAFCRNCNGKQRVLLKYSWIWILIYVEEPVVRIVVQIATQNLIDWSLATPTAPKMSLKSIHNVLSTLADRRTFVGGIK